ncbi:MAG TPA: hypothetical protein VHL11_20925 [Phototrophicaceae bacterium]|nr:hypothetical protein [Phototrophicaceae bacterium]
MGVFARLMVDSIVDLMWRLENSRTYPEDQASLNPETEAYLNLPLEEKGPFFTLDDVTRELEAMMSYR